MTIVEVCVVASIMLVLSAIGFHLSPTMKENAKQAVCISQLRQLHTATLQYGMDSMAGEEVPGLENFSIRAANHPHLLAPYVPNLDLIGCCPDFPLPPREGFGRFTYRNRVWDWESVNQNEPREFKWYEENRELILRMGSAFPYRVCVTHDQVFYAPREVGSLAEGFPNPMFVIESRWDGGVKRTRSTLHGIRHTFISPYPRGL